MLPFIDESFLIFAISSYSIVFAFGYTTIKIIVENNKIYPDNFSLNFAKAISFVLLIGTIGFFIRFIGI